MSSEKHQKFDTKANMNDLKKIISEVSAFQLTRQVSAFLTVNGDDTHCAIS